MIIRARIGSRVRETIKNMVAKPTSKRIENGLRYDYILKM
jgi:hypothetical protein